jgi:hypothetical protein
VSFYGVTPTMTDICRPVDEAKTIAPGLGINRLVG